LANALHLLPHGSTAHAAVGVKLYPHFHGKRRLNQSHASTTEPEARLFRKGKGKEAKLCFMGHVLMENRHGLIVSPRLTAATGTAERETAVRLIEAIPGRRPITVDGDKG
jgi:hypothetical protein